VLTRFINLINPFQDIMKKSAFLIAGVLLAGSASAQMAKGHTGVYMGLEGGIANSAKDKTLPASISQSQNSGMLRGALGYQFTPNWALEAGYFVTGDFKSQGRSGGMTHNNSSNVKGFDLTGIYKFDNGIYLKGGWMHSTVSTSGNSRVGNTIVRRVSGSASGTGYLLGLGYEFDLAPHASVNVGYTRLQKLGNGDGGLNVVSAGLKYRF